MYDIAETTWMHVELSSKCQAACPLCMRNDWGYKTRDDFPLEEITLQQWQRLFDAERLPNLKKIQFNGNFGDPLLAKDLDLILDYCFEKWQDVECVISTNGSIKKTDWWHNLAERFSNKKLLVVFAIDGLEDTHHLYRINTSYTKIIENAKAFINANGRAVWKMVPFRHNEHQIDTAKKLSKDLGFIDFYLEDQNRDTGWVFTNDNEGYYLLPRTGKPAYPYLLEKPDSFESKVLSQYDWDIFVNHANDKFTAAGKNIWCVSKEEKTFYLCANGDVYPCCFLGFYPKTFKGAVSNMDYDKHFSNLNNNAYQFGLKAALAEFNSLESKWKNNSIQEGVPGICSLCAKECNA